MTRGLSVNERLRLQSRLTESGCVEFTGHRMSDGYGRMRVGGRMVLTHRIAWEQANGPIPNGACVLHLCDNPPCINPDHLMIGSNADNVADRVSKGRTASTCGSANGSSKLTEADIPAIILSSERLVDIAATYGVSKTLIGAIKQRKAWRRVWTAMDIAWNGLTREAQLAYLMAVDRLEAEK